MSGQNHIEAPGEPRQGAGAPDRARSIDLAAAAFCVALCGLAAAPAVSLCYSNLSGPYGFADYLFWGYALNAIVPLILFARMRFMSIFRWPATIFM